MLKEIKKYTVNNILTFHYFIDEDGIQGFYKSFYYNGNIRYSTFEFSGTSYGTIKLFLDQGAIKYIKTRRFKQINDSGVCIYFNY